MLDRRPAFPPAGGSGRLDGDVALQFTFDRGNVDAKVVEDAASAAAGVQGQYGQQMLGADLGVGAAGVVGRRLASGGIQRADSLG